MMLASEETSTGKRERATPRTYESGRVLPAAVPMESADSLDFNGASVFPILQTPLKGAQFVVQLRQCTNAWFHANFKKMLDEPLEVMFKDAKPPFAPKPIMTQAAEQWNTLSDSQKTAFRMMIDLRTDYGMSLVFDLLFFDKELSRNPGLRDMPGKQYFRQAMIYTKQGNSGMAQGSMATAWTKKGFGKWAHICPNIGLSMVEAAMKRMERLGLQVGLPEHFPHLIYKPPDGSPLEVHHDQMNPSDLLANLREHVASSDNSTSAWVRKYGVQMLAHLQGGTGIYNGATFVVGPMNPVKMLICVETFRRTSVDGDFEQWIEKKNTIYMLDVEKYIEKFNFSLRNAGHGPVGLVPIAPSTRTQAFEGGFGLEFPVGFWHGSFSNSKTEDQAVGKGSRVTMTMPLTLRSTNQTSDPRILPRLRNMAVVSTPALSEEQYNQAGSWLQRDVKVYAAGATHTHPEKILDLICCKDAAEVLGRPVGPYAPISVRQAEVALYTAVLRKVERGESLLSEAGSSSAPLLPPEPPEPPEPLEPPPPLPQPPVALYDSEDSEDEVPLSDLMHRGKAQRPPGFPEDQWEANSEQTVPMRMPRFSYRNWTKRDVAECLKRNPLHTKPGKMARLVPFTSPPSIEMLFANDDALWMLNVKPPWATSLVYGLKDVENRGWETAFQGERYVLIVASGKQTKTYEVEANRDLLQRLADSGQGHWVGKYPLDLYQYIVGLVKVRALDFEQFTQERCSVWYNGMFPNEDGADWALCIEEAYPFPQPIKYTKGSLSMSRFASASASTAGLRDAVVDQLKLIGV